jgi:hypothetical protein
MKTIRSQASWSTPKPKVQLTPIESKIDNLIVSMTFLVTKSSKTRGEGQKVTRRKEEAHMK